MVKPNIKNERQQLKYEESNNEVAVVWHHLGLLAKGRGPPCRSCFQKQLSKKQMIVVVLIICSTSKVFLNDSTSKFFFGMIPQARLKGERQSGKAIVL
jgi:hypothetical protein